MNRFRVHRIGKAWLILLASLIGAASLHAHETSAYSHDSGPAHVLQTDWMARLPDTARINSLSIPGTHGSMSLVDPGCSQACWAGSQKKSLQDQLNMGIRALDIECGMEGGTIKLFDGTVPMHKSFEPDVLVVVRNFLLSHPSETVFMHVFQGYYDDISSFGTVFRALFTDYANVIWHPPANSDDNPMLGEVRGKIVIMHDFEEPSRDYGIAWPAGDKEIGTEGTGIQDWHYLGDNWDLYDKWTYVRNHLYRASTNNQNQLFINFLSGSGPSTAWPYFVASGHISPGTSADRMATGLIDSDDFNTHEDPDFPRLNCTPGITGPNCSIYFEGTDVLTMNLLRRTTLHRIGMIFADFPGSGLVEEIIESNRALSGLFVSNNADTGPDSLRYWINFGAQTVYFAPALSNRTITLTSGNIQTVAPVKITGRDLPGRVKITANHLTRIGP